MKRNPTNSDAGGGIGGGMSRAAKKRAKKNKKRNERLQAECGEKRQDDTIHFKKDFPAVPKKDEIQSNGKGPVGRAEEMDIGERKQGSDVPTSANGATNGQKNAFLSEPFDEEQISLFAAWSLREILLLQDPSAKDEESMAQLRELTAKQRARCLLQSIIDPIPLKEFYEEYWEKKPLIARATKNKKRYDGFLSLKSIKKMSRKHSLYYSRDLNVTRYEKDAHGVKRRVTLDKLPQTESDGESGILVDQAELWREYDKGCTIRLLCPHKHEDRVHSLLSTLESEWGCMVGANAYLTPPNASQGFAPHYDDIEAFCLQLEGRKRWKVYEPTTILPRASSEDFTTEDVRSMKQVMDVTLEAGDLLYMPRGWIHQAATVKDSTEHSLHLTVSAMQQWAWVDLLDMVVSSAIDGATEGDEETAQSLRQGLPVGFLDYMGTIHDNTVDENLPDTLKGPSGVDGEDENEEQTMLQEKFRAEAKKRIMEIAKTACNMIDAGCDEIGKRFLSDRLPPALTRKELAGTSRSDDTNAENQALMPNTKCRLARPGIARLSLEDGKAVVYHCADNSRVFHGSPISPLEFEMDDGPALEQLLTAVEPNWIFVNDLFHDTIEDKIAIAQSLYDEGILAIEEATDTP